MAPHHQPVC
ncbi:hypothetical protein GQ607_011617 [Colletotrichum asianum]|uniref:Uncharacterized protein n=1 Tax=Colletotrichum asianum TaxID=702518 RepID=A0A8H3WAL2_9PEZI|nr:hypothetical protein GQ607_011617 [Colletotrichum asianum]